MTVSEPDPDVLVTDSGGRAVRVREPGTPPATVDLTVLEPLRVVDEPGPLGPAGSTPYWSAGEQVQWHYGRNIDPVRVVRDDERGLVAWLAPGTEVLASVPVGGRALRDLPLAERFTAERELRVRRWRGPGILRVAPTGVPWSVWWFWGEDGTFAGHYVNLELGHVRPVSGEPRLHTRDLVLDLWLEDGEVWLKDEDELHAALATGWYAPATGVAIRAIADQARHELVDRWAWPLDEGWETWRPPAGWDTPLSLPPSATGPIQASSPTLVVDRE